MGDTNLSLRAQSLGEQVAQTLRQAILTGQLEPGRALRESSLAGELKVARNTVREALRILAGERLVTYQVHHGVVVATLTESDVSDLYGVRALLEPTAILDATRHDEAGIARVLEAVERLDEATRQSDLAQVVERDVDVHRSFVALANSPRLNDFFSDVCAEVRRCVMLVIYAHAEHESPHNVESHRVIADALVAGDHRRAADLALAHIYETRDQVLDLIRRSPSLDPTHESPPTTSSPSRGEGRRRPRRSTTT